jgi:hypothetical protein
MNKDQSLKKDKLKNDYQKTKGQIRPEKALLLFEETLLLFKNILQIFTLYIPPFIKGLHDLNSGKN